MDESNPWGRKKGDYEGGVDLIVIWRWVKDHGREKLRESLKRSRERYREALHYKKDKGGKNDV